MARFSCLVESPIANHMRDWQHRPIALATVAAGITTIYAPSCVADFGFKDDYEVLWEAQRGWGYYFRLVTASGRPLNGLLTEPLFHVADSISDLRWIRALGVLGVVATAWALMAAGRRAGYGLWSSAGIALLVAAMPSTMILTTWAVGAWQVIALAVGVSAGIAASYHGRGHGLTAVALIAMSLSVYQPSALAAVPVFIFIVIGRLPEPARWCRASALAAIGTALYSATTAALTMWFDIKPSDRANLPSSWSRKLWWFTTDALPASLDPLDRQLGLGATMLTASVLLTGVWSALSSERTATKLRLVAGLIVGWIITLGWVLVVDPDVMTHRIRLANHVMFVLVAATAVKGIGRAASPRIVGAISLAGVLLVVGSAVWRLNRFVVEPRITEQDLVAGIVAEADMRGKHVALRIADAGDTLAPSSTNREYGFMSSAESVYAVALVRLLAGNDQPSRIDVSAPGQPPASGAMVTIDLRDLPGSSGAG